MRWLDGATNSMNMSLSKTPGVGDGQGGLACCSPWGCKGSDTTEQLDNICSGLPSLTHSIFLLEGVGSHRLRLDCSPPREVLWGPAAQLRVFIAEAPMRTTVDSSQTQHLPCPPGALSPSPPFRGGPSSTAQAGLYSITQCVCAHTHTHMHTCARTCTQACARAHTHTHTRFPYRMHLVPFTIPPLETWPAYRPSTCTASN